MFNKDIYVGRKGRGNTNIKVKSYNKSKYRFNDESVSNETKAWLFTALCVAATLLGVVTGYIIDKL